MTAFTSGTQARDGRTVNHDPHPNVWEGHSERDQMRADTDRFRKGALFNHSRYRARPRPEFAVLDNPILFELRQYAHSTDTRRAVKVMHDWFRYGKASAIPTTPEQGDHAWRVLTKLAAL